MKLSTMIAEVRREVRMREKVYPRQVTAGKLSMETAERRIEIMRRVLSFLEGTDEREKARIQANRKQDESGFLPQF